MGTERGRAEETDRTGGGPEGVDWATQGGGKGAVGDDIDWLIEPDLSVVPFGAPGSWARVCIVAEAAARMMEHSCSDPEHEVGGILLGDIDAEGSEAKTRIRDVLPAFGAPAGRSHITFTHDTWATIIEQVDERSGSRIVGWYHTHPGFGVFMSVQDLFIQEHFFSNPGQVAVVVDSVVRAMGLYSWQRWEGGARVCAAPGIWVTAPAEETQLVKHLLERIAYRAAPV